jgi:hypothetical protein
VNEGKKFNTIDHLLKEIVLLSKEKDNGIPISGPFRGYTDTVESMQKLQKFDLDADIEDLINKAPELYSLFKKLVNKTKTSSADNPRYSEDNIKKRLFVTINILLNIKNERLTKIQTIIAMNCIKNCVHKKV